jgi:hypothetical protein
MMPRLPATKRHHTIGLFGLDGFVLAGPVVSQEMAQHRATLQPTFQALQCLNHTPIAVAVCQLLAVAVRRLLGK